MSMKVGAIAKKKKMSRLDRLGGTDGRGGRDRGAWFLSGGIKAGYAAVSSDRIIDGMPDPLPCLSAPPEGRTRRHTMHGCLS